MEITSIVVIGVAGAICTVLVKQYKPEYAVFVRIAAGIVIAVLIVTGLADAVNYLSELFSDFSGAEYIKIMLKALGICLLAQFGADTCRDAGETALASKIELSGKVIVLCLSLPLFTYVAGMVAEIIDS